MMVVLPTTIREPSRSVARVVCCPSTTMPLVDPRSWIVEDLGSTNGTYLDRTRLTTPTPIPLGAAIRIGKTVIELRK